MWQGGGGTNSADEPKDPHGKRKMNGQVEEGNDEHRAPVWVDKEDLKPENAKIIKSLGEEFTRSMSEAWAELGREWSKRTKTYDSDNESGSESDDVPIMQEHGPSVMRRFDFNEKKIVFQRMKNLNKHIDAESRIKVLEFHPKSAAALLAGTAGTASLVRVDGKKNTKLHTICLKEFPIHCGHFNTDGSQFIVGSKTSSLFVCFDITTGKTMKIPVHHGTGHKNTANFIMSPNTKYIASCGVDGYIHFFDARTKEWIFHLKMNDAAYALAFGNTEDILYSHGDNGYVYEWDIRQRAFSCKMYDYCLKGTSIAASEKFLVTGSAEGIINTYNLPLLSTSNGKVLKNLTTPVTTLRFNSTQQILAAASNKKQNGIKLVHTGKMTVFPNFPDQVTHLGCIQAVDFSPQSGYLGVVNNSGTVALYRLLSFEQY